MSDPLPLQGEPRSQVWRWLLGSSSTLSVGLIVSLVSGLVLATFGSSRVSELLSDAFQWPFWIVLLAALGVVAYRVGNGIQRRRRFDRQLELTEGLIAPAEDVQASAPPAVDHTSSGSLSERAAGLLHAIDEIRLDEYDIDALLAVYTAMESAPHRIPGDRPAGRGNFPSLIRELVDLGHVQPVAVNRVARRWPSSAEDEASRQETAASDARLAVALPALLQHHADLATRWASALDTIRLADGAGRWFRANEKSLERLVSSVGDHRATIAVVVELSRILDALEVWYARSGRPDDIVPLAVHVLGLIERCSTASPVLARLTAIRANKLQRAADRMRPRKFEATLQARAEHQTGLAELHRLLAGDTTAETTYETLEDQLENVWWKLPPEDIPGEVCALVNLAIIHLEQGRLEAAQDRLELADSLTRNGRDPSGRAHALEISGLVCWAQGKPARSVDHWRRALTLYRDLAEEKGATRCLRHLGTAVLRAPELAGPTLTDQPADRRSLAESWRDGHGDLGWPKRADPYSTESEPWRGWLRPFRR